MLSWVRIAGGRHIGLAWLDSGRYRRAAQRFSNNVEFRGAEISASGSVSLATGVMRKIAVSFFCLQCCLIFPRRRMRHFHINSASFKLIQHLMKSFFFCFLAPRIVYPPDVVILLICWTRSVISRQAAIFQCMFNKTWHGMYGSFQLDFLFIELFRFHQSDT